jgi:RNA-directed DNA polymerase
MPNPSLPEVLATAILAGDSTAEGVADRLSRALGREWKWIRPFARRYLEAYADQTRPRRRDVVRFLLQDKGFSRVWRKFPNQMFVQERLTEPQRMQPVAAAAKWKVPAIGAVGELATWLRLAPGDLEWFADLRSLGYRSQTESPLHHYRYRLVAKPSGHVRLIEAPKLRLKHFQRAILAAILDRVPIHSAAHGFCPGRSIKTFAEPHAGQRVVLRMDLQDFFPSISGVRIQTLFRTMGYPESVADLLGGICTNATPRGVWRSTGGLKILRERIDLYARPHLPQGAPTSPALANLCAYRVDCRLTGLAEAAGAHYTRYADDLAFSGGEEFERCVERFSTHVAAILREEGFAVNHRKTRIMRQGVRQHLTGLTTNRHVNVNRAEFDRLKATLTNCVRHGVESQNRDGRPRFREHLEGRVSFVAMVNPEKGAHLRAILGRIQR